MATKSMLLSATAVLALAAAGPAVAKQSDENNAFGENGREFALAQAGLGPIVRAQHDTDEGDEGDEGTDEGDEGSDADEGDEGDEGTDEGDEGDDADEGDDPD
ncbi:MAG TPA: hypothetical protein VFS45_06385, partial [Sphingomicrobium sp.]|nr:hypothetical protein [Sphingomicrobium sp.]